MYTYKDFLKLKLDELADYTAKGFVLCYVERCERLDTKDKDDYTEAMGVRLMFTNIDLQNQWGDDWNDAPYDCNAGWPYDSCYKEKDADGNTVTDDDQGTTTGGDAGGGRSASR